jgi:hypothetical protein
VNTNYKTLSVNSQHLYSRNVGARGCFLVCFKKSKKQKSLKIEIVKKVIEMKSKDKNI